jgi:hypothetical protein
MATIPVSAFRVLCDRVLADPVLINWRFNQDYQPMILGWAVCDAQALNWWEVQWI